MLTAILNLLGKLIIQHNNAVFQKKQLFVMMVAVATAIITSYTYKVPGTDLSAKILTEMILIIYVVVITMMIISPLLMQVMVY